MLGEQSVLGCETELLQERETAPGLTCLSDHASDLWAGFCCLVFPTDFNHCI